MTLLWAAPFELDYGEDVIARVKAANSIGEGLYSDDSTTNASVETVPQKPSSAPSRDATSTKDNLVINMAAISTSP